MQGGVFLQSGNVFDKDVLCHDINSGWIQQFK